jgi:hypothetical protein
MNSRLLLSVILLTIFTQILISFYSSSQIITQNNLFYKNQQNLLQLKARNNSLSIALSKLTSVDFINSQIQLKNYSTINQSLDLEKPISD